MSRAVAICAALAWLAAWTAIVAFMPQCLSDKNAFLKGFVNHEFLSFMGVVVTITLASAANLYIELNKLEDRLDAVLFQGTKEDVRHSAYALIALLVAAIILVVVKPLLDNGERSLAVINGIALSILLFAILTLIDLTRAAFGLDPRRA